MEFSENVQSLYTLTLETAQKDPDIMSALEATADRWESFCTGLLVGLTVADQTKDQ